MESHEGFVYIDELMRTSRHRGSDPGVLPLQVKLMQEDMHSHGNGSSYYKDMEELVRLLIGRGSPSIDESAVPIGNRIYDDKESSYKNKTEFIMKSF